MNVLKVADLFTKYFLITTVTLTVTLANNSMPETKKPKHLQGFKRFCMAVG